MTEFVSENVRRQLAGTLAPVEGRRPALIAAMAQSLAAAAGASEPSGRPEVTATMLVDLLIGQTRSLVERDRLDDLAEVERAHASQDISGREYSRFGDALVAVMKDVFGPSLPPAAAAAWCDAFWAIVRTMTAEQVEGGR